MVAEGRANIGITAADPPNMSEHDDLEVFHLLDDEVVVAVPGSHPWQRRKQIPQRLLLSTPLITRDPEAHDRRCVESALAERGLHLAPPLIEVGSTAVAKREALERTEPVLLSALALDEARRQPPPPPPDREPRPSTPARRRLPHPQLAAAPRPRLPRFPAPRRGGGAGRRLTAGFGGDNRLRPT